MPSWPEVTQTRRCPDRRNSRGQLLRLCRSRPLRTPCIRPPALVSMAGVGTGFPSGRRFSFCQTRLCTCSWGAFGGDLAGRHQLPAKPLHILAVTLGLAPAAAFGLHGDGGLTQPVFRNIGTCPVLTASSHSTRT